MKKLKRFKKKETSTLAIAYDILSNAGFDIEVIDGQMNVWYSLGEIEFDCEEGLCIVPEKYREQFNKRQDKYDNEYLDLTK